MSDMTCLMKIFFRKKSDADLALLFFDKVKDNFDDDEKVFFEEIGLSVFSNNIDIIKVSVDKSCFELFVYGQQDSVDGFFENIYQKLSVGYVKKFVSFRNFDQAGFWASSCFYNGTFYPYAQGDSVKVDCLISEAIAENQVINVLEKLLMKKKLISDEQVAAAAIDEYLDKQEFKPSYASIDGIELSRNSRGDSLLTGIIKLGNEDQALMICDGYPISPNICEVSDAFGNTSYKLAKDYNMLRLQKFFDRNHVYKNECSDSLRAGFCKNKELLELLIEARDEYDLFLHEVGIWVLGKNEVMYPGTPKLIISQEYFEVKDKPENMDGYVEKYGKVYESKYVVERYSCSLPSIANKKIFDCLQDIERLVVEFGES